jgi:porin
LYIDAGLVYHGLFRNRPDDKFGIGVAMAQFSDGFKEKQNQILVEEPEVMLEITYRFEAGSGIYLQPDVQFFFNPSQAKGADNGISVGLRMAIPF